MAKCECGLGWVGHLVSSLFFGVIAGLIGYLVWVIFGG